MIDKNLNKILSFPYQLIYLMSQGKKDILIIIFRGNIRGRRVYSNHIIFKYLPFLIQFYSFLYSLKIPNSAYVRYLNDSTYLLCNEFI